MLRLPRLRTGLLLVVLACAQALFAAGLPRTWQQQTSPGEPPSAAAMNLALLGEGPAGAYALTLYTQAFDAQAGKGVRIAELDAAAIEHWLDRALDLDPNTVWPLLLAARVYAEVLPPASARRMIKLVERRFLEDPHRRWPSLAHAVYVARHVLDDRALALELAHDLRLHATGAGVPAWVRQAEPLLLADVGRVESARVLLGALVAGGTITDAAELAFLTDRLHELESQPDSADARTRPYFGTGVAPTIHWINR